jgi:hypothetical protein
LLACNVDFEFSDVDLPCTLNVDYVTCSNAVRVWMFVVLILMLALLAVRFCMFEVLILMLAFSANCQILTVSNMLLLTIICSNVDFDIYKHDVNFDC